MPAWLTTTQNAYLSVSMGICTHTRHTHNYFTLSCDAHWDFCHSSIRATAPDQAHSSYPKCQVSLAGHTGILSPVPAAPQHLSCIPYALGPTPLSPSLFPWYSSTILVGRMLSAIAAWWEKCPLNRNNSHELRDSASNKLIFIFCLWIPIKVKYKYLEDRDESF